MSQTDTSFDRFHDDEIRDGAEGLAERDDQLGALARISLALADGEEPSEADCEAAGLPAIQQFLTEGGGQ